MRQRPRSVLLGKKKKTWIFFSLILSCKRSLYILNVCVYIYIHTHIYIYNTLVCVCVLPYHFLNAVFQRQVLNFDDQFNHFLFYS